MSADDIRSSQGALPTSPHRQGAGPCHAAIALASRQWSHRRSFSDG